MHHVVVASSKRTNSAYKFCCVECIEVSGGSMPVLKLMIYQFNLIVEILRPVKGSLEKSLSGLIC